MLHCLEDLWTTLASICQVILTIKFCLLHKKLKKVNLFCVNFWIIKQEKKKKNSTKQKKNLSIMKLMISLQPELTAHLFWIELWKKVNSSWKRKTKFWLKFLNSKQNLTLVKRTLIMFKKIIKQNSSIKRKCQQTSSNARRDYKQNWK